VISDEQIQQVLSDAPSPAEAVKYLAQFAIARGSRDNCSAAALVVGEYKTTGRGLRPLPAQRRARLLKLIVPLAVLSVTLIGLAIAAAFNHGHLWFTHTGNSAPPAKGTPAGTHGGNKPLPPTDGVVPEDGKSKHPATPGKPIHGPLSQHRFRPQDVKQSVVKRHVQPSGDRNFRKDPKQVPPKKANLGTEL
jgi:hypothetical protein